MQRKNIVNMRITSLTSLSELSQVISTFSSIFFLIIGPDKNYWGGQGVRRPCFTHALQNIGAAQAASAAMLPTPMLETLQQTCVSCQNHSPVSVTSHLILFINYTNPENKTYFPLVKGVPSGLND